MIRARIILAMLGIAALAVVSIGLQAQEKGVVQDKDDLITNEQQLARQFAEFQDALLRLKQRLARGTPEEKKRAETLDKVLDLCKELAINQEFTKMIEVLRTANLKNTSEIEKTSLLSDSLSNRLSKVLNLLRDSNVDQLSKQRRDLEAIIKKLETNIFSQNQDKVRTERGKTDQKDLVDGQKETSEKTKKIEEAIKTYLDPKGTEAANAKGDIKGAGKNKGQAGEAKDAGNQKPAGAKGEAKDAGKESKGAKGEAKSGSKAGDPKGGNQEPKAGEKAGADPKEAGAKGEQKGQKGQEGAAKENKSGDPKAGDSKSAGAKPGDPKQGQQGAAKGGDDKKAGGEKSGSPSQAKGGGEKAPAGAKDVKGGDAKGGDAKGGDAKASPGGDPKAGDSKAGDSKDGQGQAKAGGSPSAGGGDPKGGPPQAGQKGDGQAPPPGSPKSGDKDDVANAKKKVIEAGYDQAQAEKKLDDKNNQAAVKHQADTIKKLEDAKKKLENLLRQMREEEIERVLAALQARCEKMLMMQQQVLVGTEDLDRVINKNSDKKPDRQNKTVGLKLSDQEKDIVQEANKCIDILEAEGSAVAFPEVFQQIRQDMIHVHKRLELTDSGALTQNIERDIIENLKEMIDALKKARQDNQEPPKPGQPGKSGPPGDQKLLELLQELKMVRSLQKRVNDRTNTYGRLFPNEEQARDPQVVRELRNLSERQQRIQEIVSRIAKGDNK